MPDPLSKERRSWLMSRIHGANTGPEIALRRALWGLGVRGWRLHVKRLPGKPDLAFGRHRVAVFVDGSFWHGHPSKFSPEKLSEYWFDKISRNRERDRAVDAALAGMGWRVIRIWDIDIGRDSAAAAERVRDALNTAVADHGAR